MEIRERLVEIISKQLGVETSKIHDNTRIMDDLGADSLDQVELAMEVEEQFDINIPDDDMEKLLTVGQYVDYVSKCAA